MVESMEDALYAVWGDAERHLFPDGLANLAALHQSLTDVHDPDLVGSILEASRELLGTDLSFEAQVKGWWGDPAPGQEDLFARFLAGFETVFRSERRAFMTAKEETLNRLTPPEFEEFMSFFDWELRRKIAFELSALKRKKEGF